MTIIREDIPAVAKRERKGLEETARDFRYATFERLADEYRCNRIALGHHADDRVETILFRILRGSGRTGLGGMPIRRGKIIRPLYYLNKSDILVHLKRHRLGYCRDQSNETAEFSRNFIRNRLLPQIRNRLNPRVDAALLNIAETVAAEDEFLDRVVTHAARRVVRFTPGGKIELDLATFAGYDLWLRRRLLRRCVQIISADHQAPDKSVVDRLDQMVRSKTASMSLPGRLRAVIAGDRLLLFRAAKYSFSAQFAPGQTCAVPQMRMTVSSRWTRAKSSKLVRRRSSMTVTLDSDRVVGPLEVRNIRTGDRFRPLGLDGTKKVGDFLTDRKVPAVYRDEIPVLCDREGIIWLVGFEIADRVKITERTGRRLRVDVSIRQIGNDEAV